MTKGRFAIALFFLRARAAGSFLNSTEILTQALHLDDLVNLNSGSNHSAAIGSEN
jgi:hypothetical protein